MTIQFPAMKKLQERATLIRERMLLVAQESSMSMDAIETAVPDETIIFLVLLADLQLPK